MFKLPDKDRAFVQHLLGDTIVATLLLEKNQGSQFVRRTYVRTFFAFCEGFGDLLRSDLVGKAEAGQLQIDLATMTILKDKAVGISETGKVEAAGKDGFYRTVNFFAFTMRTVLAALGEDPAGFFGDAGWGSFRDAVRIRDRITHPKAKQDLEVADADLWTVTAASVFIMEAVSRYLGIDTKNLPDANLRLNFVL